MTEDATKTLFCTITDTATLIHIKGRLTIVYPISAQDVSNSKTKSGNRLSEIDILQ